jgi:hypothetical protein
MKSIKILGWILYMLVFLMVTYTFSNASPLQTPPITKSSDLNLQEDLEKTLYVPLHIITHKDSASIRIKTIRNTWVSINGADYQPFKVGEKIRLVKRAK